MVFDKMECQYCGEEFSATELLAEHIASQHSLQHTNRKLPSRNQMFEKEKHFQSNLVNRHKKKNIHVTSAKIVSTDVQCEFCGYCCIQSYYLRRHILKKHFDEFQTSKVKTNEHNSEILANEIVTEYEKSLSPGGERARIKAAVMLMKTNKQVTQAKIEPLSANELNDFVLETGMSQNKTIKLMTKLKDKWGIEVTDNFYRERLRKIIINSKRLQTNNSERKPKTGREKKCDKCEQELSCSFTLRRHMRTHTGEKQYSCLKCDRPYSDKFPLKRHQAKTHNNACSQCDKTFAKVRELKNHQRNHIRGKAV